MREYVGHHSGSFGKGHIAKCPVELVHIADGEHGGVRAYLIESTEYGWGKLQQVVGQLSALGLCQVVEEYHFVGPSVGAFYYLDNLIMISEVILAIYGKVFFQNQVGLLYGLNLWQSE